MGTVFCTTIRTKRVDVTRSYVKYKTGSTRYLYDNITSTYSANIVHGRTFHSIQGGDLLAYTLPVDTNADYGEKRFPANIHSTFTPNFGVVAATEDITNQKFSINFTSSNVGNFAPKYGKLGLRFIEDSITTAKNDLLDPKYGMNTSTTVYSSTFYGFNIDWDNKIYKNLTGSSLQSASFIVSGTLVVDLYGLNDVLLNKYYFGTFSNEFAHPTVPPNFYRVSPGTPLSGYVNLSWVRANMDAATGLTRAEVVYTDETGEQKNFGIEPGGRINFWKNHLKLNGKVAKIKAYYKTISNDVKLYSDELCSAYQNYYQLDSMVLSMSGYLASGSGLVKVFIDGDEGTIDVNKTGDRFKTEVSGWCSVNFDTTANTTDIYSNPRVRIPEIATIYLIAVPLSAKSDADVQRLALQIPHDRILSGRDTEDKKQSFPNINNEGANALTSLCTGSANTPTAKGVIWNSHSPVPTFYSPAGGTFDTDNYTIDVQLQNGSWIFYLVINDSEGSHTAYCLSNPPYWEMPTSDSFET
jgi:hypothetical protein